MIPRLRTLISDSAYVALGTAVTKTMDTVTALRSWSLQRKIKALRRTWEPVRPGSLFLLTRNVSLCTQDRRNFASFSEGYCPLFLSIIWPEEPDENGIERSEVAFIFWCSGEKMVYSVRVEALGMLGILPFKVVEQSHE